MNIQCPRCQTVIARPATGTPVCPNCGFGSTAAATAPAAPLSPPAAWDSSASAYPPGPAAQRNSGKAIAALVLGISALCVPYVGLVTGPLAIIFGALAIRECNANPGAVKGKGMAIAGLILGIVGFALYLIVLLLVGLAFSSISACLEDPEAPECQEAQGTGPATAVAWEAPAAPRWAPHPFAPAPRIAAGG